MAPVAVLNEVTPSLSPEILNIILAAGRQLGMAVSVLNANDEVEIRTAFEWITREHPGGLFVLECAAFLRFRKVIIELATAARIPTVYPDGNYTQDGGLMSYGVNYVEQFRRAAGYVDKILKGASASDIPVQQPTKFELLGNIRAARAMDVKVPQAVLLRADRLIE
jgi:putative ABC transport system substrate-binding protein